MNEIPSWDLNRLRSTKEYQEKRLKFIEEQGKKCVLCSSTEHLTVGHPQQYLKIFYSVEKGKFYSMFTRLKYKQVCPRCKCDKAFEDIIEYKSETIHMGKNKNKKRRTLIKSKYVCSECFHRYKDPKRLRINHSRVVVELNDYQIPGTEDYETVCLDLQLKINLQQWKKYVSFVDATLICRDCHFKEHFIPLTIIPLIKQNER